MASPQAPSALEGWLTPRSLLRISVLVAVITIVLKMLAWWLDRLGGLALGCHGVVREFSRGHVCAGHASPSPSVPADEDRHLTATTRQSISLLGLRGC